VLRLGVAFVFLGLLLPAAGVGSTASGLRGHVTLSPAGPVCIEGEACTKPARGVLLTFRRDGRVRASVRTTQDGTYRVLLRPGRYAVFAPGFRIGTGVTPPAVRVLADRVARVDLEIDTGIQ
jgi:hypothetical protein